ncbi:MAG TPA: hypothetical protein VLK30_12120 [Candidatus Limnocylindrales bacterium]|nr:hypothetical protein [Candidatus Limnocylindrales bacterium]
MTTTKVHPTARNLIVLSAAVLLVWVAVRMTFGTGAQVPTVYTVHQSAPLTAPVAAPAPAPAQPTSNAVNSRSTAPGSGATVSQSAKPVAPAAGGSGSGCILAGAGVPSKSYVRGGCPAQ